MTHTTTSVFLASPIQGNTLQSPLGILKKRKKKISGDIEKLLKACVRNDRKAQRELYEMYCDEMYTTARFIVSDADTAKDVVQLSFINIFSKIGTLKDAGSLRYWIKTIVTREAIHHTRKNIIFKQLEEEDVDNYEWPDDLSGEYLQQAILMLDEGYRAVFVLIEVEGYAHKEVAEMLNISEGTSKSQLFHARKKLKKIIHELLTINTL